MKILENFEVNRLCCRREIGVGVRLPVYLQSFISLKHFIEKNQPEVTSCLIFNSGYILARKKLSNPESQQGLNEQANN